MRKVGRVSAILVIIKHTGNIGLIAKPETFIFFKGLHESFTRLLDCSHSLYPSHLIELINIRQDYPDSAACHDSEHQGQGRVLEKGFTGHSVLYPPEFPLLAGRIGEDVGSNGRRDLKSLGHRHFVEGFT